MNRAQRSRRKTANLFRRCIRRTLAMPEQMTVSKWAERYRRLDGSSSLPGHWSNAVTPYLVEIMDCFNDPYIQSVNFVKSTQVGGTEALINAVGWIIDKDPSPAMIVYPTEELAKDISNDRLKPALRLMPEIQKKSFETKSSAMDLRFRGMNLYLRSGGSPSALASKAIKYLFFDEIDKMQGASKKEASPYSLATERTKTFRWSRKIYTCSTPTIRSNYIWTLHEEAEEQKRYYVPCPHCGEYITLDFKNVRFTEDPEKKMSPEDRAATALYYCQSCGSAITDREKHVMLTRGEWRTEIRKGAGRARSVSYHINALYSFFVSWSDAAKEFLKSKGDPEKLQNFVNSWLGEPWEDTKIKTSEELVMERQAAESAGTVPPWAQLLTAGVDVQENCLYFDIVAWGVSLTSQSIYHGQILSFSELDRIMDAEYKDTEGNSHLIELCCIDSGDQTDDVYEYCLMHDWAVAVKGVSSSTSHFRISKINKVGKSYDGQPLVLVDGGRYKDMIAANLQRPNGKGSCMVHANCDSDYAQQLTAEHKVAVGSGTKRKLEWQKKTSHADNHYLDCRVYASCAADMRGVRSLQLWQEDEERRQERRQEKTAEKNEEKEHSWIEGY